MSDENVERSFRAGLQYGDEFRLVTAPRKSAGPIRHAVPFWRGVRLNGFGRPHVQIRS